MFKIFFVNVALKLHVLILSNIKDLESIFAHTTLWVLALKICSKRIQEGLNTASLQFTVNAL